MDGSQKPGVHGVVTYNTDSRKPLRGHARQQFLADHQFTCHVCRGLITTDLWDEEHIIARELVAPGTWADEASNLAPVHRGECHKTKTALDRKLIAKSNRIRRKNGPVEGRKKTATIKARANPWPKGRKVGQ